MVDDERAGERADEAKRGREMQSVEAKAVPEPFTTIQTATAWQYHKKYNKTKKREEKNKISAWTQTYTFKIHARITYTRTHHGLHTQ